MHVNDIKAFAGKVANDEAFRGKKVVIRAPEDKGGKYLSRRGSFDATKPDAFVYDYDRDGVSAQVAQCAQQGMTLEIELAG